MVLKDLTKELDSVVFDKKIDTSKLLLTKALLSFFCFCFVSRFERAIADFGMNTGVIATGLILLRMVDPECRTPVPADFAFKQLLHSPFMGGGIWTCLALPLLSVLK